MRVTPYFTLDPDLAGRAARGLLAVVPPEAAIAYAVKVNPHPALLREFLRHGLSAEVVSLRELDLALSTGFPARNMIVNGPAKSGELFAKASRVGAIVHLESLWQVDDVVSTGRRGPVGLRVRVAGDPPSRFGLLPHELQKALAKLHAAGMKPIGLHAHRSTGLSGASDEDWRLRAAALRRAADILGDAARSLRYLDWGGGITTPDLDRPSLNDFRRAAARTIGFVGKQTAEIAERHGINALRLIVEPGRFLAEHSGTLESTCLDIVERGGHRLFVLDAGVGMLAGYDCWLGTYQAAGTRTTADGNFAGPSCMEEDVLPVRPMTGEPRIGGRVTLTRCGAYQSVGATTFYHQPAIVSVSRK
jgi:diaminopimelate decarboxylase